MTQRSLFGVERFGAGKTKTFPSKKRHTIKMFSDDILFTELKTLSEAYVCILALMNYKNYDAMMNSTLMLEVLK